MSKVALGFAIHRVQFVQIYYRFSLSLSIRSGWFQQMQRKADVIGFLILNSVRTDGLQVIG